jgi:uncharacterized MAPEG superfamily protein
MTDSTSFPALNAFALALVALFLKTTLTSALQVISRIRAGAFPIPEDARLMKRTHTQAEAPFVQRCANVWRNDTENLPLFMALGLTYVLLGATAQAGYTYFGLYVLVRYIHSMVYLRALQPWRAMFYLLGLAICWAIAIQMVLMVFTTRSGA